MHSGLHKRTSLDSLGCSAAKQRKPTKTSKHVVCSYVKISAALTDTNQTAFSPFLSVALATTTFFLFRTRLALPPGGCYSQKIQQNQCLSYDIIYFIRHSSKNFMFVLGSHPILLIYSGLAYNYLFYLAVWMRQETYLLLFSRYFQSRIQ